MSRCVPTTSICRLLSCTSCREGISRTRYNIWNQALVSYALFLYSFLYYFDRRALYGPKWSLEWLETSSTRSSTMSSSSLWIWVSGEFPGLPPPPIHQLPSHRLCIYLTHISRFLQWQCVESFKMAPKKKLKHCWPTNYYCKLGCTRIRTHSGKHR